MKSKTKKKFLIPIAGILVIVLFVAGYYAYQLFIVPKITNLSVPTVSYPRQSVIYSYFIQSTGLEATFGDQTMPASQVTTELIEDMKNIKSIGFDGIKLTYTFRVNNYLADRIALRASQEGLYPIGLLEGFRAKPKDRGFTPEEMTEWLSFVREEVSTQKNITYYWEIWNEPGLEMFKYGSPEEFVQLLKVTYPVIKEANPDAKVIVTLSAEAGDTSGFEDQVLALGGGDYFDILSFHPYGANPYLQEDQISAAITREQALVDKYHNQWPLVISEVGQPTSEVSEEEQARLAVFLYTEAAKKNIPVTWYYWSDERLPRDFVLMDGNGNWGLIRNDGTERPIVGAIRKFLK
ncbi:MAG: hypothetical protein NTZ74_00675 [Chloroflexi bacterium]|nr:hypothetical protein [Chloroflexota bacterium]